MKKTSGFAAEFGQRMWREFGTRQFPPDSKWHFEPAQNRTPLSFRLVRKTPATFKKGRRRSAPHRPTALRRSFVLGAAKQDAVPAGVEERPRSLVYSFRVRSEKSAFVRGRRPGRSGCAGLPGGPRLRRPEVVVDVSQARMEREHLNAGRLSFLGQGCVSTPTGRVWDSCPSGGFTVPPGYAFLDLSRGLLIPVSSSEAFTSKWARRIRSMI